MRDSWGAEDITIHPQTGVAYISSDDRRAPFSGQPQPGAIYALDLRLEQPLPKNITPQLNFNCRQIVCTAVVNQSDIWVMESFDPEIK